MTDQNTNEPTPDAQQSPEVVPAAPTVPPVHSPDQAKPAKPAQKKAQAKRKA